MPAGHVFAACEPTPLANKLSGLPFSPGPVSSRLDENKLVSVFLIGHSRPNRQTSVAGKCI